jgi:FeS assembly protein IscX
MDEQPLYWENTYEIVLALIEAHPDVDINALGLDQLQRWVIALPGFADNPRMVTDAILNDILREWYEEITPL